MFRSLSLSSLGTLAGIEGWEAYGEASLNARDTCAAGELNFLILELPIAGILYPLVSLVLSILQVALLIRPEIGVRIHSEALIISRVVPQPVLVPA